MSESPPPPPSTPPIVHVGKKSSPTAAAALGKSSSADSVEGTDQASTVVNIETLRGKTFVQKLHAILALQKYSSIISWNDAGDVATIHDGDAFISTIVPLYFKKTKFGSFIRKMRRWGFSALTRKSSESTNVIEFSSEHFLRDQPDLCRLMKDERNNKKQFSFLDRNVRKNVDRENVNEGSSAVLYPSTPANTHAANYPTQYQQLGDDNSTSPMMIPPHQHQQSYHYAMPNMMPPPPPPPPPPQHQYSPPYGYSYGAPPHPPGVGYGPSSPYRYPAPDGFATYPPQPQPQPHQMMQHNQQPLQMMQHNPQIMQHNTPQRQEHHQQLQHQSYEMMQPNQQFSPSATQVNLTPISDERKAAVLEEQARASNTSGNRGVAVLTSSSEESAELLPNPKVDLNVQIPNGSK